MQRKLEDVLFLEKGDALEEGVPAAQQVTGSRLEVGLAAQTIGALLESVQDISASLRSLVQLREVQLGATAEQQMELLLIAKNIEISLTEISDTTASRWNSA